MTFPIGFVSPSVSLSVTLFYKFVNHMLVSSCICPRFSSFLFCYNGFSMVEVEMLLNRSHIIRNENRMKIYLECVKSFYACGHIDKNVSKWIEMDCPKKMKFSKNPDAIFKELFLDVCLDGILD